MSIRLSLDLKDPKVLSNVNAKWKFRQGYVPGEDNEGLIAQRNDSPARKADYDDSSWDICNDIEESKSTGFTFGWYRITVTIPQKVDGVDIEGFNLYFETCIDDYGEIWIDGQCDFANGVIQGFNKPQRVRVARAAEPGKTHVIACLAINGPLGEPGGEIFMRYAQLAFEKWWS